MHIISAPASYSCRLHLIAIWIQYVSSGYVTYMVSWGTNVAHYGLQDLGHGTCYAAPWRAGANENTTFSFSHPVQVEGKDLPAGTYGFSLSMM